MLRRAIWLLVAFPAAIVLTTLAVINRQSVRLILDPFRPDDPLISLVAPLYAYVLGALIVGVILGGSAAWVAQRRWRGVARRRAAEAVRWQAEADRLARDRDRPPPTAPALAPGAPLSLRRHRHPL